MDQAILLAASVIIGFFAAISGIGGGALLAPALIISGIDAHVAIGISLCGVALTSLISALEYLRQKLIDFKVAGILLLASIPGALLGTQLSHSLDTALLERVLGAFLVALAAILLVNVKAGKEWGFCMERSIVTHEKKRIGYRVPLALIIPASFLAGFASGLFGIGGGVLIMPAMLLGGIPAHVAVATSCLTVNLNADVSLLAHLSIQGIEPGGLLLAAPGLALGAFVGARLVCRFDARLIRMVLCGLLLAMAAMLLL